MFRDRWIIITVILCVFSIAGLLVVKDQTEAALSVLGGAAVLTFMLSVFGMID